MSDELGPPASRVANVQLSVIRQMASMRREGTIDLGLGEPDIQPSEWMRDVAMRVAREEPWSYSPNAGLPSVRQALACHVGVEGVEHVCITAGSQEALFAIAQAWFEPGDEVLVPDPGFLAYPTLVELAGARAVPYPLIAPDWKLDRDRLSDAVTSATRAIIINSPSNPTGSALAADDLDFLLKVSEDRGLLVISDEIYREIWWDASPAAVPRDHPRTLIVGGMSKSHAMTGLRAGWVCGDPELLRPVIIAHQYITTCASVFAQRMMEEVLRSPSNDTWLDTLREHFAARAELAVEVWNREVGIPVARPQGAFYLFAPVPSCSTGSFARRLLEVENVLTIPGSAFGREGEGWLRISCAASAADLEEGIRRVARQLEMVENRSCD